MAPLARAHAVPTGDPGVRLDGLTVEDVTLTGGSLEPPFNPAVTRYTLRVQPVITHVRVTPVVSAGTDVEVAGTRTDSGAGVVIAFGQDPDDYDRDLAFDIRVTARRGGELAVYTVTVLRPSDRALRERFAVRAYTDPGTGETIPYALYLPREYNPQGSYPLVLAMHGSGQRPQGTDMVLKFYRHATVWAEDAERGHNPCVVLAPHCATRDDDENWTTLMRWRHGLEGTACRPMPKLLAAYRLLLDVIAACAVDRRRVYLTGLSAGGFASWALASRHPETFAAVAPCCGGLDPALAGSLAGLPIWLFHAADDRQVDFTLWGEGTMRALDQAGVAYRSTIYPAGAVFAPSPHWSWVPTYANREFRDWLFRQVKP